jgi:hypothetical protein
MSQTLSETELLPRRHDQSPTIDPATQATTTTTSTPPPHASPASSQSPDNLRPITARRQALILLSSFLTICITIGFNQSYGVFQSYYTSAASQTLLPPEDARAQSAWIAFVGALGAGLTWGGSIVVNPFMARVRDVRWLTVVGVVCMSAGFGLASFGTEVWVWGFFSSFDFCVTRNCLLEIAVGDLIPCLVSIAAQSILEHKFLQFLFHHLFLFFLFFLYM